MVFLLISFSHFSMLLMWNLLASSCQVLNPNSQEYMHTQGAQFKFFPLFLGNTRCIHILGSNGDGSAYPRFGTRCEITIYFGTGMG